MVLYKVFEETVTDFENKTHIVFGIAAFNQKGEKIADIHDIFTDKYKAESFVQKLNRLEVSVIHIYEIIDDVL